MGEARPTIEGSMLLGLLELSPVPLSAEEIAMNFNLLEEEVADVLVELAGKGLVRPAHTYPEHYEVTELGSMRVELRSPAD